MSAQSIKAHMRGYSIAKNRKTTVTHAFASAIAPCVVPDHASLDAAIQTLGQDPNGDLECVYCDALAETWDHLNALVKGNGASGFGHSSLMFSISIVNHKEYPK